MCLGTGNFGISNLYVICAGDLDVIAFTGAQEGLLHADPAAGGICCFFLCLFASSIIADLILFLLLLSTG